MTKTKKLYHLVKKLDEASSYIDKIKVIQKLGKLGDERAVPFLLIESLKNDAVLNKFIILSIYQLNERS